MSEESVYERTLYQSVMYDPRCDCMDCSDFLHIPKYHNYCRKRKTLLVDRGDEIIYLICPRKYEGKN